MECKLIAIEHKVATITQSLDRLVGKTIIHL